MIMILKLMFMVGSYQGALEERAFMSDYLARTDTPWLSFYPRPPPILTMWPAAHVGQTHVVTSPYGKYACAPAAGGVLNSLTGGGGGCEPDPAGAVVPLHVVSIAPRVFVLEVGRRARGAVCARAARRGETSRV